MDYAAVIAHFPKMTYHRYKKALTKMGTSEKMWQGELGELVESGFEPAIADEFVRWRDQTDPEKILERLRKENITVISWGDARYPRLLAEISDPPQTIFVRGDLSVLCTSSPLAVVGTRRATSYGKQITEQLVTELVSQGITIVSGLALGIDGLAHETTLRCQGRTIAVLGSGNAKKSVYPREHESLAERIASEGGALVSEYPPDFAPTQYSFPARNRIIAGLTLGTLVIEAPEESGALITARAALDYNREVCAVPHPITSLSGVGNNNLLKKGALLVTKAEDILEALHLHTTQKEVAKTTPFNCSPTEELLLSALSTEPVHIDELTKFTRLDSTTVNSTLMLLELKQQVKNVGGMKYVRK